jgi:peptide/nickel transport system substrate-binding protein
MHARNLLALLALLAQCARASDSASASVEDPKFAPGPALVDEFHPERRVRSDGTRPALPEPAYGGRVIVHLEAMPKTLCYTIDNSAVTRRIQYELNETLLRQDWEMHDFRPNLAERFEVEDTLVLAGGRGENDTNCVFGTIADEGDAWSVKGRRIAKKDTERVERGTVITLQLRPGVKWHDGHPFDARDVLFSWSVYSNPEVQCGEKRQQFQKIVRAEMQGPLTVRFYYGEPYALMLQSLGDMFILPSHLYDLTDPDNADGNAKRAADPAWTPSAKEQGEAINSNRHNREWVGLGPYRLAKWDADVIEAKRFDDYFDPENGGYLDTIRWRYIQKAPVAFQALLAGELDFYSRMTSDEYFGEATDKPLFTDRYYKGYYYSTTYWYIGWNLKRPQLADVRVRRALAQLFDFEEYKRSFYKGLAVQVTGPSSLYAKGYNHDVEPLPYDPVAAEALLAEAGWYDRDGDGVLDKDGRPFEIQLLLEAGNPVGQQFALRYQENLARVGIRFTMMELEMATLLDRRMKREFDAVALGWAPPLESDPGQVWSSSHEQKRESSNFVGYVDEASDRLIERIQREIDGEKRAALLRELHARIYELQPYLFAYNPPRKFAMSKAIRGFQAVHIDPNYVIRRWYYPAGTPGTRAMREPGR